MGVRDYSSASRCSSCWRWCCSYSCSCSRCRFCFWCCCSGLLLPFSVGRQGPENRRLIGAGAQEWKLVRMPAAWNHLVLVLGYHNAGQSHRQIALNKKDIPLDSSLFISVWSVNSLGSETKKKATDSLVKVPRDWICLIGCGKQS